MQHIIAAQKTHMGSKNREKNLMENTYTMNLFPWCPGMHLGFPTYFEFLCQTSKLEA